MYKFMLYIGDIKERLKRLESPLMLALGGFAVWRIRLGLQFTWLAEV